MELHADMKWSTLIEQVNKKAGKELFRYNGSTGEIYKLHGDSYVFWGNNLFDKAQFIEDYA